MANVVSWADGYRGPSLRTQDWRLAEWQVKLVAMVARSSCLPS